MGQTHAVNSAYKRVLCQTYCHEQPWWENAVHAANSVEAYKRVVHFMFEDGHVNQGRLQVLEIYTKDVCTKYQHLAHEIWKIYFCYSP